MSVLRLFIAAYPPPEVVSPLLSAADLLALGSLKPSPPDQVHLTLVYIGDTDERQLDDVIESMHRAAAGFAPISVDVSRLIALPERGAARLIAAELTSPPTLVELQKRLVQRLTRTKPSHDRGFLPHLTLARFPGTGVALDRRAWEPPGASFSITDLRLMSSVLATSGAVHCERARCNLGS
ncbi:MAG: RNA 2',3'-cyclic phosphodiesterase [Phycisphaerae bacterium]|nr:RNA 2',3'-cyclic phosphodiesterase [Phycisphaerae bacterium]